MPQHDEYSPEHPDNKPPVVFDNLKDERALLEARKGAYTRVMGQGTPSRDDRRIVMADLKVFCRGERTPWDNNDRYHCLLTGRHEVYTRIMDHLRLSVDELVEVYAAEPQTGEQ